MFEDVDPVAVDPAADGAAPVDGELDAAALQDWADALADLRRDVSDEELVDRLRVLEELKAAASAAQARAAADLDASVRDRHRGMGLPAARQGIGVAAQVGLARRDSPVKGAQHLGLAKALTREMPYTLAALTEGRLSEWRATLLVRETACLSREDRARVDRELVGDRDRLAGLGDRAVAAEARRLAYQLDPGASVARSRKAAHDRRVTLRPAPDTMTNLTGLMPVAHGVATYAALSVAADQARATGDERTRGQVMADTLYERVTGQSVAIGPDVSVGLVVTDRTLFAGDDEPAVVPGYGPVPAPWATRPAMRRRAKPDHGQGRHDNLHGRHEHREGRHDRHDHRHGRHDHRRGRGLRPAALHPSAHRGTGGDGVAVEILPARAARPAGHARPGLPHSLVRRPRAPRRPRDGGRGGRGH
jgi:hypothetical protein